MEFGCSCLTWRTEDGTHLLGRTYDAPGDLRANRIVSVPRRMSFAPDLTGTHRITGRYACTGMALLDYGAPMLIDGVNEAGLTAALLQYPGCAVYGIPGGPLALHPGCVLTWLLTHCASVSEAAQAAQDITLLDAGVQGHPMQVHYLCADRSGEAIVLEPNRHGLAIHRHTLGVLTNSPDYGWHKTHLRCFAAAGGTQTRTLGSAPLSGFSRDHDRCAGLPGGFGSPARFVRAAFVREAAITGKDELDGVSRMFQLFSCLTVPEGVLQPSGQHTQCTAIMSAESGMYYVSTARGRQISTVAPQPDIRQLQAYPLPAQPQLHRLAPESTPAHSL